VIDIRYIMRLMALGILLGVLLQCCQGFAETPDTKLLLACELALDGCNSAVKAQADQITVLKDSVKQWKKEAQGARDERNTFLVAVATGAAAGALAGDVANRGRGLLPGGVVGLLVGAVVGLLTR
jgi:hypothetical protein